MNWTASFLLAVLTATAAIASTEYFTNRHAVQTFPVANPQTGAPTPVTFKLDTLSGNIWRLEGSAFIPISVEETWTLSIHDNQTEYREKQRRITELAKKMDQIILPELNFRQADIRDVITSLQQMSVIHSPDQTGFSMALFITLPKRFYSADFHFVNRPSRDTPQHDVDLTQVDPSPPLISFTALELTLRQALDLVTDQVGMQWRFVDGAIQIRPQGFFGDGNFFSRMYDLAPSAIKRLDSYLPELWDVELSEQELSARWQAFFAQHGVTWPIGSSMQPLPLMGKLSVRNDATNLQRINQILNGINTYPPTAGRFQLIAKQGQDQQMIMLLDSALGHTWNYTTSNQSDAPSTMQDAFFQYLNH